jgi:S1-C subfamily serine protease
METPPDPRRPLHELFKHLAPAVPLVEAEDVGSGSGFLVKHDGKYLVVTNRHVIENARKGVAVHFLQGDGKDAEKRTTIPSGKTKVVAVHRSADLAVLDLSDASAQIDALRIDPVRLAPASHRPQVGEHAFAIGHPGGEEVGVLTRTLSDGIVSAVGRKAKQASFLQVTVPVNPGNSGGPLFDDDGRVVGVNTFTIRKSAGRDVPLEALNFVLEVSFVHEILNDPSKSITRQQIAAILRPDTIEATADLPATLQDQVRPFLRADYRILKTRSGKLNSVFRLPARGRRTISVGLPAGRDYAVVAVAERADDIDLAVFSFSEGRVVAADMRPDAHPRVTFRTASGGRYLVVVMNPSDTHATVALAILRKSNPRPGGDARGEDR